MTIYEIEQYRPRHTLALAIGEVVGIALVSIAFWILIQGVLIVSGLERG